jgi:ophiobolin F synthase
MPALVTASLVNDLFSFEKERNDTNVQNAVLVVMREHGCSEEDVREICQERIRVENAKYVRVVRDTRTRTDLSDDVKRYIEVMQYTLSGNVAWSSQCPRYNAGAKWNELQLLRAEHGVEKYPARWPPKDATGGLSVKAERKEPHVNGNIQGNGHKRKRNGNSPGDDIRMNGTNGVKKPAHISQPITDSLVLADVVSLALDWNLPELSDNVSSTSFFPMLIPLKR